MEERELGGERLRRSFCDICAPGPHCGVLCRVKDGAVVGVEGDPDHPASQGRLCTRGRAMRQYVYRPDRVLTPLRRVGPRGSGDFEPITWEQALGEIAGRLKDIRGESGASSVAFYSGYNKWYRPFLQRLCHSFGSVNYGSESSTCFTATILSWQAMAGVDCVKADLARAGVFLGWCFNPYHSGHLKIKGLEAARRRGMKLIIVDPRATVTVQQGCDLHLRPRPGTDGALALGLGRALIHGGWIDREAVENRVHGFGEYAAYVEEFTPERVEQLTGVPAGQLLQAARLIGEHGPLAINQSSSSMVHHTNGLSSHRAIMALSAITGSFNRPGGLLPDRLTYAHSRGGFATRDHQFAAATRPKDGPLPVGCADHPLWHRLTGEMQAVDLAGQILSGKPYPVRALVAHGLNYRMFPDSGSWERALQALDFYVDVDLFLTDSARLADLVLPACSSLERGEFKVYPGNRAQYTAPVIPPLGQSLPDTEIITRLARALELDDPLLTAGYDACLKDILRDLPVDLDALKAQPETTHVLDLSPAPLCPGDRLPTPTGKFELRSTLLEQLGLEPLPVWNPPFPADPAFPMTLVAGARLPHALHSRLHDVPWLRSLRPAALADISREDAQRLGLKEGDRAVLSTPAGSLTVPVHPTARVLEGTVHLYHGYREADVNRLVPGDHRDPDTGFPAYDSVPCALARAGGEPNGEI